MEDYTTNEMSTSTQSRTRSRISRDPYAAIEEESGTLKLKRSILFLFVVSFILGVGRKMCHPTLVSPVRKI